MKLYTLNENEDSLINRINPMIWIAMYFVMSQAMILENSPLMTVTVAVSVGYCIFAPLESIFCFLCGLAMYESVFSISGNNAWFVILLIFVFKMSIKNNMRFKRIPLVACMIVIYIEFVFDYFNGSLGEVIVTLAVIAFVFSAFTNLDKLNIRLFDVILSLSTAFLGIVYYIITMYGGLTSFLTKFMSLSYAYRFGHDFGNTTGGAMAIPLYADMIITCCMAYFLNVSHQSKAQTIYSVAVSFFALFIGAVTISRSFYLCLLVSLVFFVLFKNNTKTKNKYAIIAFIIILAVVLVYTQQSMIDKIIENLNSRMDAGVEEGEGGRTDIWLSCINYLLTHPIRAFTGFGAANYKVIGVTQGELFSAGSHNLLLDLLMSWGIIGTIVVLTLCISELHNSIKIAKGRVKMQAFLPLITYIFFSMTALRCSSLKTWMFLLVACLFVSKINREELL